MEHLTHVKHNRDYDAWVDTWCTKRHATELAAVQRLFYGCGYDDEDGPHAPHEATSTDTRGHSNATPLERSPTPPPVPPPSPVSSPQAQWLFLPPLDVAAELPPLPPPAASSSSEDEKHASEPPRETTLAAYVPAQPEVPPLPEPRYGGPAFVMPVPMVARKPNVDVLGSWCLPTQEGVCTSFPSGLASTTVEALLTHCPYTKVEQEWFYCNHQARQDAMFVKSGAELRIKFGLGERLFTGPVSHRLYHMRIVFYNGTREVARVTIAPSGRDFVRHVLCLSTSPNTNLLRMLVNFPKPRPGARRTKGLPKGVVQRMYNITFQSQYAGASLMFRDNDTHGFLTVYARAA